MHPEGKIIKAAIMGIYMRNNNMKDIPINEKTMKDIINYIAPFYITMSQYDYDVIKNLLIL